MQKKFLREHHNRQDKTRKPDYREGLIEESAQKASAAHLQKFRQFLERTKGIPLHKQRLIQAYRNAEYHLGNHKLCLDWSFRDYVAKNEINERFNQTFKRHKSAALADFQTISTAIQSAKAIPCDVAGISQKAYVPRFTVSLVCASVIPDRGVDDLVDARELEDGVAW
jgi:hypothetical protein